MFFKLFLSYKNNQPTSEKIFQNAFYFIMEIKVLNQPLPGLQIIVSPKCCAFYTELCCCLSIKFYISSPFPEKILLG
eukprot:snap_masked-scaffold_41-processed-gene-0.26-mRNA-1 protein AED:1.00 eAED:1.00 QI:0/0/0/0/1/1/2/0/76